MSSRCLVFLGLLLVACDEKKGDTGDAAECGDDNPLTHVDNEEICDGVDNDCDGLVDNDAVDRDTFYIDEDGDGYGTSDEERACLIRAGLSEASGDCDDTDAAIHPGAEEVCDGLDNTCDGAVDEGLLTTFYVDSDQDGYGDPLVSEDACAVPSGYVENGEDCDDSNPNERPGALWYPDLDGDGFGSDGGVLESCEQPAGYILFAGDCDDTSAQAHPGVAAEDPSLCMLDADGDGYGDDDPPSGVDPGTDCDDADPAVYSKMSWYADLDGDGYGADESVIESCDQPAGYILLGGDCDDTNPDERPGTSWHPDFDGDGFGGSDGALKSCEQPAGYVLLGGVDCDDTNAQVYPGAAAEDPSLCMLDADGDGYGDDEPPSGVDPGTDCDDTDPLRNPGEAEVCDEVDNNCDGILGDAGIDADGDGQTVCEGDCDDDDASVWDGAAELLLDDVDNDCDGAVGTISCDVSVPTDASTVNGGIQAASAGDVVCVEAGTYGERVTVNKAITLVGEDGADNTTIRKLSVTDDALVEGFTIEYTSSNTNALVLSGSDVTVAHTTVTDARTASLTDESLVSVTSETAWLHGVTVQDFESICNRYSGIINLGSGTVLVSSSELLITDSEITGNFSCGESSLVCENSTVRAVHLDVNNNLNRGTDTASGVSAYNSSLYLTNSVISDNRNNASDGWHCSFGGGLSLEGSDTVLRNVAILDNNSDYPSVSILCGEASGIAIDGGTLEADSLVLMGNEAGGPSGALHVAGGASVTLRRASIVGNNADYFAAIYATRQSSVEITDSIIYDNSATSGAAVYLAGTVTVSSTNIYDNSPSDTSGFTFTTGSSGNRSEDPDFLASDDLHLDTGSSMIDASTSGSVDPDESTGDLGAFGGLWAQFWDVDADGLYLWWEPGSWSDSSTDEDDGW